MLELIEQSNGMQTEGADSSSAPSAVPDCGCREAAAAPSEEQRSPLRRFDETFSVLSAQGVEHIDGYVLFSSHADAIALYQAAKAEGMAVRISPTPRDARSSCGVALLIPCAIAHEVHELARKEDIPVESMVALPKQINPHRDKYC